jgi:hypothetical protein
MRKNGHDHEKHRSAAAGRAGPPEADGGAHRAPAAASVEDRLAEIDCDPTAVFWG